MKLTSLDLEEFRGYRNLHIEIDPAGLRLFGANASGKSSLLEAVAMLATTRSPRTSVERDVIAWESGEQYGVAPYTRLHAAVESRSGAFGVAMTVEAAADRGGKLRKQIRLDGRQVRAADAVGRLKAVLFSVEDVALVSGAPLGRRRYLDLTISQVDGRYLRTLSSLNRVLAQRNSLLKSFARDRVHVNDASVGAQLAYWDDELVRFGALIYAYRIRTVRALSDLLTSRFAALTDGRDIRLTYLPNLTDARSVASLTGMSLEELAGIVARDYSSQVAVARRDEVRRGVTLVGPHRDDLAFIIDGVDLASFGSRGEQRLAVVALKLAEADLMRLEAEEPPILMLDDVLSELDESHRDHLVLALSELDGQLLVTATGRDLLRHPALVELPEAHVRAGTVEGVV